MKSKLGIVFGLVAIFTFAFQFGLPETHTSVGAESKINSEISPEGAGVAIFFGGVVVGYVVDGAIQYSTGNSAADWVEEGFQNTEDYILSVSSGMTSGSVTVSDTGQVTSCPHNSGPCPLPTQLVEEAE